MPDRKTGADYYIAFKGVDITPRYRRFDPGLREETADVTAGGDQVRLYAPTLRVVNPRLTGIYDSGTAIGTAILAALTEGGEGTLLWGPEGTATGRPKWGILARVTRFNIPAEYDGETEIEVEWANRAGAFLFDGRTATW